jgi:hypothetical protein
MAWLATVPVWALFGAASWFARGEANWAAPAAVGLSLGLASTGERTAWGAWAGGAVGLAMTIAVVLHVREPIVDLDADPATRLEEGKALADWVSRTTAEQRWEPLGAAGMPVTTERYQEAAFVRFYAGLPATRHPGCGRPDQYDLDAAEPSAMPTGPYWFLRPARSGDDLCGDPSLVPSSGPWRLKLDDEQGRYVGTWELFVVGGPP